MKNSRPKLRFSGFNDNWEDTFFAKIATVTMGQSPSSNSYNINKIGMPLIQGNADINNRFTEPRQWTSEPTKICDVENLILTVRAPVGYVAKSKHKACIGRGVCSITSNNNNDLEFIYQFLLNFEDKWSKLEQGSTFTAVSGNEIKSINLKSPSIQEQTKIANFLSSVDDKINQLTKKKNLLENYKKGVMQKIFNQEIKFKDDDGNDYPNWKNSKIGKISKIYDGTHQTPNYVDKGIPFYSVEHVSANQFETTKFISEDVFEKENKRVKLEKGDILMTRIGSIGVAKYINWDVKASFYVSLALIKQSDKINNEYLYHFITTDFFQAELWKRTIHVAFPQKINLGEISECLIKIPVLEEQNKIAKFLTTIDDKINQVTIQLDKTKEFKKGLLQQMFI